MSIQALISRSKQIVRWLWRGKYNILTFASVIATVLYLAKLLTFHPSLVALALSLTGLIIILAQQILDAREYANHTPNTILNWLKSYPKSKNIVVNLTGTASVSTSGKARISIALAADAPLDKKVEYLLQQNDALHSAIARVDDRVDEVQSSLKKIEKGIEQTIGNLSSSIRDQIAGHIVGAYDINLFGITITVCGTLIQFFSA
jgi:hypothetical protein